MNDLDARVRLAAFAYLDELAAGTDAVFYRDDLERGFVFEGSRVRLMGPQGIFKPSILPRMPISITTVPIQEGKERPYDDSIGADGLLRYRYRGTNPLHHENVGLRQAMVTKTPLIYFHGIVPGRYAAAYPAFIVSDDPGSLSFTVATDDRSMPVSVVTDHVAEDEVMGRRMYVTRTTIQRLHQQDFRTRVLEAYRRCCAVCRLKHVGLLDAAHILPDRHPQGMPVVSNGLALCKIHHAAFDCWILGIRPDLVIEIREDILREVDGPMLEHGLQRLHGKSLAVLPSRAAQRPRQEFLEERYEHFRKAAS